MGHAPAHRAATQWHPHKTPATSSKWFSNCEMTFTGHLRACSGSVCCDPLSVVKIKKGQTLTSHSSATEGLDPQVCCLSCL